MDEEIFLKNNKLDKNDNASKLRADIMSLVEKYSNLSHSEEKFIPGETTVPVSGKVYSKNDLQMLISASLDFWLTAGRFNDEFERRLSAFFNKSFVLTTNSGSSANLLAITALTSQKLAERALSPGDEVITAAAGFPTTVNPILQNNLIPVFVDVDIPTYSPTAKMIERAITEKTKAIILAHTLGNPFEIEEILKIAQEKNIWIIEDCCDAFGSSYNNKLCGTFGDIATLSFYPAHHITTGEGGALFTRNPNLFQIIQSFRDWGRDCFCPTGVNNTCGKRFDWKLGELPQGYDHKFIYSHLGYNLKITDMQAAVGLAQIKNIEKFISKRRANFDYLKQKFKGLENFLILPEPTKNSKPSWFGFPITIRDSNLINKSKLTTKLSERKIDSRPLFAGNITKQPYLKNQSYKISGELKNTDKIMNDTFWLGVYPGLDNKKLDYVASTMNELIIEFID